jgi:RHS repeat-associated protein
VSYNAFLGITSTTDVNGKTLSMTYDSAGRPATARNAWGSYFSFYLPSTPPSYSYTYSAQGVTPVAQTKTGIDGVTVTTLDGFGRVIRISRGDSNGPQSYTDTVYAPCACSPLGKVQQVSQPYAPGSTPAWTVYSYDEIGRTLSVRQPDGASATTYSYSGNQTTITDPAGKWKTVTSDALGNLVTVTEPDPASPPNGAITTSYTYDWMNHVSQVTMPRGSTTQTRTFVYNDAGLLTSATNPENGTVLYYYNADNTLHYKHDAKGQETVYSYDEYKRVTTIQRFPTGQSNPEDMCQRAWIVYGGTSGPITSYGRITDIEYGSLDWTTACVPGVPPTVYHESYVYWPTGDVNGKSTQILRTVCSSCVMQSGTVGVNYTYSAEGRLQQVSGVPILLPFSQVGFAGSFFNYGYDSMGRPTSLQGPAFDGSNVYATTPWVQGVQYDPAGRMTQMQFPAGVSGSGAIFTTETMSYNANGQMVSQNWSTPQSLGPTGGLTYSYSSTQNNGQITQVSDTISGETISYQYDALKRLTSVSSTPQPGSSVASWTQTFQFDGFGNLTAKVLNGGTPTLIPANPLTNQLSNASYDLNGNMTSGAGANLNYDVANRITSATEISGGAEYYTYDAENRRIYKLKANGTEEWTLYGAFGEKLGVFQAFPTWEEPHPFYNLNLQPVRSTVSFAGRTIIEDGAAVFQDRLGTNRASGARFYPYGEEITSTTNDRVKFGTYTRDSYTGLDYADQRFYASSYGRFNRPDPAISSAGPSDPGSWNRYSYTRGDPINRFDPRGLCDEDTDTSVNVCDTTDEVTVSVTQRGGGGPFVGTTFGRAETALETAQMHLANRNSFSDKCQGGMAAIGVDPQGFADNAYSLGFGDGSSMTANIGAFFSDASLGQAAQAQYDKDNAKYLQDHNLQHLTLSGFFAANPQVDAWSPANSGMIWMDPSRINVAFDNVNQGLIMHEMLHAIWGKDDGDIMTALKAFDPGANIDPKGPSVQITNWLVNNCVNGKGNH